MVSENIQRVALFICGASILAIKYIEHQNINVALPLSLIMNISIILVIILIALKIKK